ncbi:MAG: hypothetical protein LBJ14_10060 [Desulfarculales bacterium]|jgi:hypothetical protein|nr:hypothetical protein [Desulfarculales bacterium]
MALEYDPINQRQEMVPDYAPSRYPEPPVQHVQLAAAPPPVMPPAQAEVIVSAPLPANAAQAPNPAPPTTEAYSNWPAPAPPQPQEPAPDPWRGSNVDDVV